MTRVRRVIITVAACWIWLAPISIISVGVKFLNGVWDLAAYQQACGSATCWAALGLIIYFSVREIGLIADQS